MERSEGRNQFLDDIIEGALYGCAYWADGFRQNGVQTIWEFDQPYGEKYILNRELIAKGINKILNDLDFEVNSDILKCIAVGNRENDACNIDAECCDVIVQSGIFGEIVFG